MVRTMSVCTVFLSAFLCLLGCRAQEFENKLVAYVTVEKYSITNEKFTSEYDVKGTVVIEQTDCGLGLQGVLHGLKPLSFAGMHIHKGTSCSDPKGHFYDDDPNSNQVRDFWMGVTWASDQNGAAVVSVGVQTDTNVQGNQIPSMQDIDGRVFVVHGPAERGYGPYSACGVIRLVKAPKFQYALLSKYPNAAKSGAGNGAINGLIAFQQNADDSVNMFGSVTGLEKNKTNLGIHVHAGFSCFTHALVKGHYFEPGKADPWLDTKYDTDAFGATDVNITLQASLNLKIIGGGPFNTLIFRTVVMHQEDASTRIACGVIGTATSATATLTNVQSGSTSGSNSKEVGMVTISDVVDNVDTADGIDIKCMIGGLEPSANAGMHVHVGADCNNAEGHYYTYLPDDPWTNIKYTANESGYAGPASGKCSAILADFSVSGVPVANGYDGYGVAGRVYVIHNANGEHIACGEIIPNKPSSSIRQCASLNYVTAQKCFNQGKILCSAQRQCVSACGDCEGFTIDPEKTDPTGQPSTPEDNTCIVSPTPPPQDNVNTGWAASINLLVVCAAILQSMRLVM